MTKFAPMAFCMSFLLLGALGCGTVESHRTVANSDSASAAPNAERRRFEIEAEERLAAWNARIDSLRAKADVATGAAKAEMKEELDGLVAKRQEAAAKLEQLKAAGDERWSEAKRGMADVLDDLDRSLDGLRRRLRE